MKRFLPLLFCACLSLPAAVVYRFDPTPVMTTAGTAPPGGYPALYAVSNATIVLTTDAAGTIPATSYTDATGVSTCPINAPVTQGTGPVCSSTTGSQGQFGFWLQAGNYYYRVILPDGTMYGPFALVVNAPGVAQVNGAIVPASQNPISTNSAGQFTPATVQGNGAKVQLSTGIALFNDLVKFDAFGNTVDTGLQVPSTFVTSFNSRTGAVAPTTGDYTYSQISGAVQGNTTKPQMAGTNSGVPGATLCDDANGNATTSGCTSGGVISFNTRTGAVVPTTGDYTYSQIGGAVQGNTTKPQMAGTNSGSPGALLCDDANGNATTSACNSTAGVSSFNSRTGAVVPTTGDYTYSQIGGSVQGNTTKPQMAGTNSNVAGALLCDDANGNATTTGCGAAGGVTSFNSRTGAVVPTTGDYTYSQIGGTTQGTTTKPQMAGSNSGVTGALLCDDSNGNATTSGCSSTAGVSSFNSRTGAVVPTTGDYTYSQIGGAVQGNTTKPQMAGTNSGVAGTTLCDDANGNATTSGCSAGGSGVSSLNGLTGALSIAYSGAGTVTPSGTTVTLTPPCPYTGAGGTQAGDIEFVDGSGACLATNNLHWDDTNDILQIYSKAGNATGDLFEILTNIGNKMFTVQNAGTYGYGEASLYDGTGGGGFGNGQHFLNVASPHQAYTRWASNTTQTMLDATATDSSGTFSADFQATGAGSPNVTAYLSVSNATGTYLPKVGITDSSGVTQAQMFIDGSSHGVVLTHNYFEAQGQAGLGQVFTVNITIAGCTLAITGGIITGESGCS